MNRILKINLFALLSLILMTINSYATKNESPALAIDKMIEHQAEAIEKNKDNKNISPNKELTKFYNDMIAEQEQDLKSMQEIREKLFPNVKKTSPDNENLPLFSSDLIDEFKKLEERMKMALSKFSSKIQNDKEIPITPRIEIKENAKAYEIKAEVPGIARDNIKVKIKDNDIMISARRESEVKHSSATSTSSEFHYGDYERTIHLDKKVDPKSMHVEIKDGIVDVRLKKVAPDQGSKTI